MTDATATMSETALLRFFVVERHLRPMLGIAADLGDDLINVRPDLPDTNSAYVIVWHCAAVIEWWSHQTVLGLPVDRDRKAELAATGTAKSLTARVDSVIAAFDADLPAANLDGPLKGEHRSGYVGSPIVASARGVMLHLLEELAAHHGHLDLTRDWLRAGRH